jgi:hypothetical protein
MGRTREGSWRGGVAQMAMKSFSMSASRAVAEAVYKGGEKGVDEEWVACGAKGPNFRDSQSSWHIVWPLLLPEGVVEPLL